MNWLTVCRKLLQIVHRKLITLGTIHVMIMVVSCSPLYVPTSRTLNHFSSRGEVNTTALVDWSGLEGRATVSVTDHLFIHAGVAKSFYGLLNQRDTTMAGGTQGSFNHRMLEIGAGYYGRLLGRYAEVEGGYGRGKSDVFESIPYDPDGRPSRFYPSRVIVSAYHRFYVNAGIGLVEKEQMKFSFNARVTVLKFSKIYSASSQFTFDKDSRFFYVEPAFDLRHYIKGSAFYFLGNTGFCIRADQGARRGKSITAYGARPEVWGWNNAIGIGFHIGRHSYAKARS